MRKSSILITGLLLLASSLLATTCGPVATPLQAQQTTIVSQAFQQKLMPLPTVPTYRCGAWASNNAPYAYSTITIFARLTKNVAGVGGATASATVHFTDFGDVSLDSQPVSDNGGYVSFSLSLAGRQPEKTPATVSVTFKISGVKSALTCTNAFFTPQ